MPNRFMASSAHVSGSWRVLRSSTELHSGPRSNSSIATAESNKFWLPNSYISILDFPDLEIRHATALSTPRHRAA